MFYIKAGAALTFCKKFYEHLLMSLEKHREIQIGKILRDVKREIYEL